MKKITPYQLITILATIVTITINALANILPFNGLETGEISDSFPIYFVPAGYVFSIWSLIYLGLIAFTIYQALPSQRENKLIRSISPAYWISSLANSIWMFLWHYEVFSLTLVAMLTILATLVYIYLRLSERNLRLDRTQKLLVKIPFSIYLGWITVATVANASQLLFFINWGGWGIAPQAWAVIMIAVATLLGMLMRWREGDAPYLLVLIWAFIGIGVGKADTALVANAAYIASGLLALALVLFPFLKKNSS
jgi:hypothetical protein